MSHQLKVLNNDLFGVDRHKDEPYAGVRLGQIFNLLKDRISFGRSEENDIPLYSRDSVRAHGQFIKVGDDYAIEEFPNRYPVLVNNSMIEGKTLLKDGDIIRIFAVLLEYQSRGFAQA